MKTRWRILALAALAAAIVVAPAAHAAKRHGTKAAHGQRAGHQKPHKGALRANLASRYASERSFPRIDAARQRQLDADRRTIIAAELRQEEAGLARALETNSAPEISRYSENIGALRRELASVK